MIPIFILAIEDDADRIFMINLYEQCRKAMYYQALDILHDHGGAEDTVHDVLVKLMDRIPMLKTIPESQLLPYALTAAKTTAIDRWRSRNKVHVGVNDCISGYEGSAAEEHEKAFINMERVDILSRGLEKLSESDRDILKYRYLMDMSDEEIAGILGIKPGSVRMYLTRARKNAFAIFDSEGK